LFYNDRYVEVKDSNFTENSIYKIPANVKQHSEFLDFYKNFPNISHPGVFGFHANADITKDIGETNLLFESLILCSGSAKGGGSSSMDETLK
jgi:dynein heavy chain, axonemal